MIILNIFRHDASRRKLFEECRKRLRDLLPLKINRSFVVECNMAKKHLVLEWNHTLTAMHHRHRCSKRSRFFGSSGCSLYGETYALLRDLNYIRSPRCGTWLQHELRQKQCFAFYLEILHLIIFSVQHKSFSIEAWRVWHEIKPRRQKHVPPLITRLREAWRRKRLHFSIQVLEVSIRSSCWSRNLSLNCWSLGN